MRKTICLVLALSVAFCLLAVTALAGTADAGLKSVEAVLPGSTFTVTFSLKGTGLYGVSGTLRFDSDLLELVAVEQAIGEPWALDINGNHFLAYDDELETPISDETVVFTATFRLLDAAVAGTELVISCIDVIASDRRNDVNVGTVACTVAVVNCFPGDVDGNGSVDAQDLSLLRRYLAGRNVLTGVSAVTVEEGADINGDGHVDAIDLAMLRATLK